jgi:hypothetical protein
MAQGKGSEPDDARSVATCEVLRPGTLTRPHTLTGWRIVTLRTP